MRVSVAVVLLAVVLGLVCSVAVQIAGDVGPGEHGPGARGFLIAGDVGPGEH